MNTNSLNIIVVVVAAAVVVVVVAVVAVAVAVVVVVVESSFLQNNYCLFPPPVTYVFFQLKCPSRGSHLVFHPGNSWSSNCAPGPRVTTTTAPA